MGFGLDWALTKGIRLEWVVLRALGLSGNGLGTTRDSGLGWTLVMSLHDGHY